MGDYRGFARTNKRIVGTAPFFIGVTKRGGRVMRIPTKKIAHSELKTIRTSPSDAVESIVRQMIVMSQEKRSGYGQHHFVSVAAGGAAGAKFA